MLARSIREMPHLGKLELLDSKKFFFKYTVAFDAGSTIVSWMALFLVGILSKISPTYFWLKSVLSVQRV